MAELKVAWNRRALNHFEKIAEWYFLNLGEQAATKFAKGIQNTLQTLSHSPQIGFVDESRSTQHIIAFCLIPNTVSFIDILTTN